MAMAKKNDNSEFFTTAFEIIIIITRVQIKKLRLKSVDNLTSSQKIRIQVFIDIKFLLFADSALRVLIKPVHWQVSFMEKPHL